MADIKGLSIFKPGSYHKGQYNYSLEDVRAMPAAFQATIDAFARPVKLTHKGKEIPLAMGTITGITADDMGTLFADLTGVPDEVVQGIKDHRILNRSAEIYHTLDGHKNVVRALSFETLNPPEVKGLDALTKYIYSEQEPEYAIFAMKDGTPPDGTGPHGRGAGPGSGKADGSGKIKATSMLTWLGKKYPAILKEFNAAAKASGFTESIGASSQEPGEPDNTQHQRRKESMEPIVVPDEAGKLLTFTDNASYLAHVKLQVDAGKSGMVPESELVAFREKALKLEQTEHENSVKILFSEFRKPVNGKIIPTAVVDGIVSLALALPHGDAVIKFTENDKEVSAMDKLMQILKGFQDTGLVSFKEAPASTGGGDLTSIWETEAKAEYAKMSEGERTSSEDAYVASYVSLAKSKKGDE